MTMEKNKLTVSLTVPFWAKIYLRLVVCWAVISLLFDFDFDYEREIDRIKKSIRVKYIA